jgi:elongation factor G
MGELHLEVLVDRMKREFRVEANVGKPQVAYRETIKKKVEKVDYTHKKADRWFGSVRACDHHRRADLEEGGGAGGYEFVNGRHRGRIPREYIRR